MKAKLIVLLIILLAAAGFWAVFFNSHNQNFSFYLSEKIEEIIDPILEDKYQKRLENPPVEIKSLYATIWTALSEKGLDRLIKIAKNTEVNALVVDVKDYTGEMPFYFNSPLINFFDSKKEEGGKADLKDLIKKLHRENIYAIARVAVFQDLFLSQARPDLAIKSARTGEIWRDRKGLGWLDPASQEVWNYILALSRELEESGFDEINFDYIRFPSDGDMKDVSYPFYDEKTPMKEILKNFFSYLSGNLRPMGIKTSADLFGLAAVNKDDLGIGQALELALPYFDFICPMVYPSHYAGGFLGFENPAQYPYEVVKYSLQTAQKRRDDLQKLDPNLKLGKVRPWLQDFDLGADYDEKMIRLQKKAVADSLTKAGWMLWDPKNIYTTAALDK